MDLYLKQSQEKCRKLIWKFVRLYFYSKLLATISLFFVITATMFSIFDSSEIGFVIAVLFLAAANLISGVSSRVKTNAAMLQYYFDSELFSFEKFLPSINKKMTTHNLDLVLKNAKQYSGEWYSKEDLLSENPYKKCMMTNIAWSLSNLKVLMIFTYITIFIFVTSLLAAFLIKNETVDSLVTYIAKLAMVLSWMIAALFKTKKSIAMLENIQSSQVWEGKTKISISNCTLIHESITEYRKTIPALIWPINLITRWKYEPKK